MLEELADLIQNDNHKPFQRFADCNGANRGNRHKQVFVDGVCAEYFGERAHECFSECKYYAHPFEDGCCKRVLRELFEAYSDYADNRSDKEQNDKRIGFFAFGNGVCPLVWRYGAICFCLFAGARNVGENVVVAVCRHDKFLRAEIEICGSHPRKFCNGVFHFFRAHCAVYVADSELMTFHGFAYSFI